MRERTKTARPLSRRSDPQTHCWQCENGRILSKSWAAGSSPMMVGFVTDGDDRKKTDAGLCGMVPEEAPPDQPWGTKELEVAFTGDNILHRP